MKRFLALCMAGVMLMSAPVFADGIVYEGQQIQYSSQEPVIINSRTYVPIRDVFEKLGFEVEWDADTKIVYMHNDYRNIVLITGTNKVATFDFYGFEGRKLENQVQLVNGRTMLPLREILESSGYEIQWDSATKTTTIVDTNNYVLKTYIEKVIAFGENTGGYVMDTSKPVGKLTTEEKTYLSNLYEVFRGDKYESLWENSGIDEKDSDTAKKIMQLYVGEAKKDLASVPCPESLKAVDTAVKVAVDELPTRAGGLLGLAVPMLEGETDNVKGQLIFILSKYYLSLASIDVVGAIDELNSFYTQNNIDPEAEFKELG